LTITEAETLRVARVAVSVSFEDGAELSTLGTAQAFTDAGLRKELGDLMSDLGADLCERLPGRP
jgi:hypothetical protein